MGRVPYIIDRDWVAVCCAGMGYRYWRWQTRMMRRMWPMVNWVRTQVPLVIVPVIVIVIIVTIPADNSTRSLWLFLGFTPLFSKLLKFYEPVLVNRSKNSIKRPTIWTALHTMFLHSNMCVQMVQRTIRLIAVWPRALIKPLDFVVSPSRTLLHSIPRQCDKRIGLAVDGITNTMWVTKTPLQMLGNWARRTTRNTCTYRCRWRRRGSRPWWWWTVEIVTHRRVRHSGRRRAS